MLMKFLVDSIVWNIYCPSTMTWSLIALDSFLIEFLASTVAFMAESFDFCHLMPVNIFVGNDTALQNVAF